MASGDFLTLVTGSAALPAAGKLLHLFSSPYQFRIACIPHQRENTVKRAAPCEVFPELLLEPTPLSNRRGRFDDKATQKTFMGRMKVIQRMSVDAMSADGDTWYGIVPRF